MRNMCCFLTLVYSGTGRCVADCHGAVIKILMNLFVYSTLECIKTSDTYQTVQHLILVPSMLYCALPPPITVLHPPLLPTRKKMFYCCIIRVEEILVN